MTNMLIAIIPRHLPAFLSRQILAALSQATAHAVGCPVPSPGCNSYDASLHAYALFTQQQAELFLQSGRDIPAMKTRLYQNAYPLGRKLRRLLWVDAIDDVMALSQILYRAIGVEIQGDRQGNLTVKHCYYSQFYTSPVCDLISALDDGIFAGLSGGYRLTFSERITEGRKCCRARLAPHRQQNACGAMGGEG